MGKATNAKGKQSHCRATAARKANAKKAMELGMGRKRRSMIKN